MTITLEKSRDTLTVGITGSMPPPISSISVDIRLKSGSSGTWLKATKQAREPNYRAMAALDEIDNSLKESRETEITDEYLREARAGAMYGEDRNS